MCRSFVSSKPHESITGGTGQLKQATRLHRHGRILPMEEEKRPFWKRMLGMA